MSTVVLLRLMLIAAVVCLGWLLRRGWLANASRQWPQVAGRMLQSRVVEVPQLPGTDVHDDPVTQEHYRLQVRYTYAVGARRYQSRRIGWQLRFSRLSHEEAEAILHSLGERGEVAVYYDPRNPARAVLMPGASAGNVIGIAIACAVLVLAWHLLTIG